MKSLRTITLLAAALFCGVLGVKAETLETIETTIDGLNYTLIPATVRATLEKTAWDEAELVIPATVTYDGTEYEVTSIAEEAFQGNEKITSVVIGDNVDYINAWAFNGCTNLAQVTFGKKNRVIGAQAFRDTKVTEIVLPDNVSHILGMAFYNCDELTKVVLGSKLKTIVYTSFMESRAIADVYCYADPSTLSWEETNPTGSFMPDKATRFHVVDVADWSAFSDRNVTFVGDLAAFVEDGICYYLNGSTAYVGKSYKASGDITIRDAITVEGVEYPVTAIGDYAFEENENITSVVVGNNVTTIGTEAFRACEGLKTLTIPASVNYIGDYAFFYCTGVEVYCEADPSALTWATNEYDFDRNTTFHVSSVDAWIDAFPDALVMFQEPTPVITLYADQDNSTVIDEMAEEDCTVIIKGKKLYKDGCWNTLCLPFNVEIEGSIFEDADIMIIESTTLDENGMLTLSYADVSDPSSYYHTSSIPANYPVLVKWANTGEVLNEVTFEDVSISYMGSVTMSLPQGEYVLDENGRPQFDQETGMPLMTTPDVSFQGSFAPVVLQANDLTKLYVGGDNKLLYPTGDVTVGAFSAYFSLNNGLKVATADAANANLFGVSVFVDNDVATGITIHNATTRDDAFYTLDGRRLSGLPTQSGIYIKGNKKVLVKGGMK